MMDRERPEDDGDTDQTSYFCYKTYIKMAGYTIFILYSMIGIKRLYDHINQWMILDRCTTCRSYNEKMTGLLWGGFDLLLYGLAPLSALFALIHVDIEWLIPTYAIRAHFPSFILTLPIMFTISSYILYWLIDVIIDVQQVSDNLLDMEVWKRCIWASALLITNTYSLLLAIVVSQLIYYQHYIIIEEQVMREQQNLINEQMVRFHRNRRRQHGNQFIPQPNQPGNAGILVDDEELNDNEANIEHI